MAGGWDAIWNAVDGRVRFGVKPGLERMRELMDRLGHPERELECVQVAGTNGKGATAYALWRLLELEAPAGLFTSPHLLHPSERIRLDHGPLDERAAQAAWDELAPHLSVVEPSYFECLTALALLAFRRAGLRRAVLECGLGGRWDATSVVTPVLSLLTNVGADHLQVLGPSLEDVARDKAHVAPPGGWLLHAVDDPLLAAVVEETALQRGASCRLVDPLAVAALDPSPGGGLLLRGKQGGALELPEDTRSWRRAGGLALAAWTALGCGGDLVPARLRAEEWPGRFHVRRRDPPVVLDVAHNPPALTELVEEVGRHWPGLRFQVVVAGMRDKALAENLRILAPVTRGLRILLLPGHPRAATRTDWLQALDASGQCVLEWLEPGQVEDLGAGGGRGDEPWLVTGSFLAVGAWLGARRASPGL
jgi:dihydrofolate synthase/folylpolyglutamate synthase